MGQEVQPTSPSQTPRASSLEQPHVASVASTDDTAGPRWAVVWYRLEPDGRGAPQLADAPPLVRDLKRDPRVGGCSVIDAADAYRWVGADRGGGRGGRRRGAGAGRHGGPAGRRGRPRRRWRCSARSRGSRSWSGSPASATTSRADGGLGRRSAPALAADRELAGDPRRRDRARTAGWASSLWTWDHLNAIVGPWERPDPRGLDDARRAGAVTERASSASWSGPTRSATRADREARHDPRSRRGRPRRPRHRRRLVRARARGLRDRLRGRLRRAARPARRGGHAPPAPARRRDRHARRAASTGCRRPVRPRPVQPQIPILVGGSGPKKTLRTVARYGDRCWNTSGPSTSRPRATRSSRERCARSAATRTRSSERSSVPTS